MSALARLPLAVLLLAAACAQLPGLPVVSPSGGQAVALLAYFERIAELPVERQQVELAAAQGAFERNSGDANRLRLAMVLSLPQVPWHDDARAVALVAPLVQAHADDAAPLRNLALLLQKSAVERLRLVDEQRRREAALRAEQRRSEELQQKLDALRAIDRDMRRPAPRR